jgi:hypothetical protein
MQNEATLANSEDFSIQHWQRSAEHFLKRITATDVAESLSFEQLQYATKAALQCQQSSLKLDTVASLGEPGARRQDISSAIRSASTMLEQALASLAQ